MATVPPHHTTTPQLHQVAHACKKTHFVVDPVEQPWHRDKDSGAELMDVVNQLLHVSLEEANLPSTHQHETLRGGGGGGQSNIDGRKHSKYIYTCTCTCTLCTINRSYMLHVTGTDLNNPLKHVRQREVGDVDVIRGHRRVDLLHTQQKYLKNCHTNFVSSGLPVLHTPHLGLKQCCR